MLTIRLSFVAIVQDQEVLCFANFYASKLDVYAYIFRANQPLPALRSPRELRLEDRGEILITFGPDGLNLGNEFMGAGRVEPSFSPYPRSA